MNIIDNLKNIIFNKNNRDNQLLRNVILLGLIGLIFLFAGNLFFPPAAPEEKVAVKVTENMVGESYQEKLARQLQEILSAIAGVGESRVQLMTERSTLYEYEYNLGEDNKITNERDQNDGERRIIEENIRKELVIIRDSSGQERPVIRVEQKPEITGVLIVAEGAHNSEIRYRIYQAVSSFLGLPWYKINVLPQERG